MRSVFATAVLASCCFGCDALFGLVEPHSGPIVGPQIDAGISPDASCGKGTSTILLGARAGGTGQASMSDTFLVASPNETKNYGAATTLGLCASCSDEGAPWDNSSAVSLLRFDTSAICPGSTVVAATLLVDTTADNLGDGEVSVFPVLEEWVEGSGAGSVAAASWEQRMPGVAWSDVGVGPPLSRGETAVGTFMPLVETTPYSVSLAPSIVQAWLDKPATNFGMVLVVTTGNSDCQLRSREASNIAARPGLSVTIQVP